MSEETKEQLLKVTDVARACQISIGAVYAAIRSGRLKAAQLGSRKALRIEPREMRKWIQNTEKTDNQGRWSEGKTFIV